VKLTGAAVRIAHPLRQCGPGSGSLSDLLV